MKIVVATDFFPINSQSPQKTGLRNALLLPTTKMSKWVSLKQVKAMKDPTFKILFVDDQRDSVEPLMNYTQSLGFEALWASEPKEAMEIIRADYHNLIVVISDYEMGDVNGLQFRGMMLPRYQDIPFVICSGFVDETMLRHGLTAKVSSFVDKPYDFDAFDALLKKDCQDRLQNLAEQRVLRRTFIEEAFDLLEEFEAFILELESRSQDQESIQNIFRIVHTIKGGSGVLDWPEFTRFLHVYEDLLSRLKNQQTAATPEVTSKLLQGYDFLSKALKALQSQKYVAIDIDFWTKEFQVGGSSQSKTEAGHDKDVHKEQHEADETIKIPTRILDEFMELSGEITVIRNTVNKLVRSLQKESPGNRDISILSEYLDEMHKINSSMQGKITELRKVSIHTIFKSYPRTIRDLSLSLKKDIELRMVEDGLRIDTKLANVLRYSLIHLIRNSADHGIESPEERRRQGKPERGVITLQAIEQGEDVVIDIRDDGRGINTEFIGKTAVQKGLITAAELDKMSEKQILKIIFESGFSTAAVVTDVSGRGVGMDMVRSSVESVGGRIEIDSIRGQGSRFNLKLPIPKSVLIIHSLRVRAGSQQFNIPQDRIVRLIKVDLNRHAEMINSIDETDLLKQSGQLFQLIDLKAVMQGSPVFTKAPYQELNIAMVRSESLVFGILVDAIEDAEEVVVKRLAPQIQSKIFLGSTFLGDGNVGLIIDTQGLATMLGLYQEDTNQRKQEEDTQLTIEQRQDYLIFQVSAPGTYALPIQDVYRLEDLDSKQFTYVGGKLTIIYRDRVMPLTILHSALGLSQDRSFLETEKVPAIICSIQGIFYGLLVSHIQEIISTSELLDESLSLGHAIAGNLILHDKIITVLDLYKILNIAKAPVVVAVPMSIAPAKTSAQEEPLQQASGWGLF